MSTFKKIDKTCNRCGVMLYNVSPDRCYCDACREELRMHPPKKEPDRTRKMTLTEIMREADKEGLQYASYCKKHGLY